MLTRHGWMVGGGALGLSAAGRSFGLVELYICGAAAGVLLVVCLLWVRLSRLDLAAGRSLEPARVHAGSPARARIRIRNSGTFRTPVLRLVDPVTGTAGADLLLNPLRGGESASIAYRLPTQTRGLVGVGPLDVLVSDPFGLTSVRTGAVGTDELMVLPRIDRLHPPRQAAGPDPTSGAAHPSALGRSGDEFYALRPYVVGDDLRRVHWASTARTGELVVRQDELPWQGRTTVVLDRRRGSFDHNTFEVAVSAVASIIDAAWHRGDLVRLVTSEVDETKFGSGHAHREAIMERLAVVQRSNRSDLTSTVAAIERSGSNGALLCVSGRLRPSELVAVGRAAIGFGAATVVDLGGPDAGAPSIPGLKVLRVPAGRSFHEEWQKAHQRRGMRSAFRVG